TPPLSSEERGPPHSKLRVFLAGSGGCIREKDRSWRGSVFRPACCFLFCFCRTSRGNPPPPASLPASPRKNRPGTHGQISNDKTVLRPREPFAQSPRQNRSNC